MIFKKHKDFLFLYLQARKDFQPILATYTLNKILP